MLHLAWKKRYIYNVTFRVFLRVGSKSHCDYLAQSEKKGSISVL